MSLSRIFDPIVVAYFKKLISNGSSSGTETETVIVTMDCSTAEQCYSLFSAMVTDTSKVVLFLNSEWVNKQEIDGLEDNECLCFVVLPPALWIEFNQFAFAIRIRGGGYAFVERINSSFDLEVSAGQTFEKVTIA